MKKLKILFIAHSGDGYGANHSLLDILMGLDKTRFEPVLVAGSRGFLTENASRNGIPVYIEKFRRWTRLKLFSPHWMINLPVNFYSARRIKHTARSIKADLIYTNTAGVLSGALAARRMKIPHIWHIREEVSERPLEFNVIHRLSKKIIVNSRATQSRFSEPQRGKTAVVYNGFSVPAKVDAQTRLAAKRQAGLEESIVLTLIGSIDERKGQREAAQALPEILARFPKAKLVFVGKCLPHTADYEEEVRVITRSLGIEDRVVFYGFTNDLEMVYAFTDLLIVPSRYEAFGRVIVEGMLYGVPVVATRSGGIPEIIENGTTGGLVEGRDPHLLAGAVIHFLENPDRCSRIAEAGRLSVINKFGMENMVQSVEKYISEAVTVHSS